MGWMGCLTFTFLKNNYFFKINAFLYKFCNGNLINLFMVDTILCCKGMANRLQENDPK